MGNCNIMSKEEFEDNNSFHIILIRAISLNNFQFLDVIGKGGFGKVWKVKQKKTKQMFALKVMSKSQIVIKKSVSSVLNERIILLGIKHNFIINMQAAFQDREYLYLLMDLLTGGDLRYHIGKKRRFSEEQTSTQVLKLYFPEFFIACILIGLEYLHQQGILHRDIKPENLVFDNQGYLRLTDLGIARIWKPENSNDTSGTPGYMAPEVMCRHNHGIAADYFAVGVIVYECMLGRRPYVGRTRQEIRDQILAKQVQIKRQEIPLNWSIQAVNFANQLIQRKPQNRLGNNGPEEVKNHPWFIDFNWENLQNKSIIAPYKPNVNENNYLSNESKQDSDESINLDEVYLLRRKSIQDQFNGYNNESESSTIKSFIISKQVPIAYISPKSIKQ